MPPIVAPAPSVPQPAVSPHGAAAAVPPAPIIRADGLGKRFKLYPNPWGRVVEWLSLGKSLRHEDFWALRGVSFELRRGESLGVIGTNGSGKSTLLKILSGAMYPTQGTFEVSGRVLSLLELGTGLNPQLTGRENVVHSARLLAFDPAYAVEKMPRIEAFAELGEFFDRPIRVYSSGMMVRLAFSMFACFEPDVFIVDEALSVGDVFFQQKCVARIEELLAGGTTMLFVSHDMQLVRRLCGRAILLSNGQVHYSGPPDEAVARYFALLGRKERDDQPAAQLPPGATAEVPSEGSTDHADLLRDLSAHNILPAARSRHGARGMEIVAATFQNEQGHHALTVAQSQPATIRMLLRAHRPFDRPSAGLHLYDRLGNLVFAAGATQLRVPLPPLRAGDELPVTIRLTFSVQPGEYTLSLGCAEAPAGEVDVGVLQDQHEGIGPIAVHHAGPGFPRFYGIAQLPMELLPGSVGRGGADRAAGDEESP
jgi:ABC-type polysaccharide/polyol phosphate transport system ATPase subunit